MKRAAKALNDSLLRFRLPRERDFGRSGCSPALRLRRRRSAMGSGSQRYSSIANAGIVLPLGALVLAPAQASSQLLQKCLRVHQISRVKALGELLID